MNGKYKILQENSINCKRLFGIKFEIFEIIFRKVQQREIEYLLENPLSNRGLAGEFPLAVGGTSQLTATISPSNATNQAVATVNTTGLVTGVAAGTAT